MKAAKLDWSNGRELNAYVKASNLQRQASRDWGSCILFLQIDKHLTTTFSGY